MIFSYLFLMMLYFFNNHTNNLSKFITSYRIFTIVFTNMPVAAKPLQIKYFPFFLGALMDIWEAGASFLTHAQPRRAWMAARVAQ